MPWKLIAFVIMLVLATIFVGFNLDNQCDINFGFYKFSQVPVFMTILFSFVAGVVIMIPFTFGRKKQKNVKTPPENKVAPKAMKDKKKETLNKNVTTLSEVPLSKDISHE
jgi:uncharacterized integral membrane protein